LAKLGKTTLLTKDGGQIGLKKNHAKAQRRKVYSLQRFFSLKPKKP
jgi:hypothetical protein